MIYGQKKIAQIKNKAAARKYREKKKQYQEIMEKQLHDVELAKNKLELENAGLRAEN